MPPKQPIQRDIVLLLPAFQPKVRELLQRMRARGFDPFLFETVRTPQRAAQLEAAGKSNNGVQSLHCYKAAADFISEKYRWADPKFFVALGQEARALKLTWGGDWDNDGDSTDETFYDGPHVQAVTRAEQDKFRALPTDEARNAFLVAKWR